MYHVQCHRPLSARRDHYLLNPNYSFGISTMHASLTETGAGPSDFDSRLAPRPVLPVQDTVRTEENSIFLRLKWSVLESPSEAEIYSLDAEGKPHWTPLFLDPAADEAATIPPLSCMKISMEPINFWEYWQQEDKDPPEALIENTDGQPISVKQFMQAFYDYAVPLRALLCRCCDIWRQENQARVRFYYTYTFTSSAELTTEHPYVMLSLDLVDDIIEDGQQVVSHLKAIEAVYQQNLPPNK